MKKSNLIIMGVLSLLFIATFIIGCKHGEMRSEPLKQDTVTITTTDTIYKDTVIQKNKYIPYEVIKLRTDTIRDSILTYEQKIYQDTLVNDKDTLVQRMFISGVNVKLDSTKADWKKHTEVITNTVIKVVEKPKTWKDRFDIGIGVGYGIGLNNKEFEPFLGVNFSYKL